MSSLASLFNPKGLEQPVKNTDEYKVSFKDGKGGVYESVVRFIPYVADPNKSCMTKQVSWVKNPLTQKGMYVDDPRSIGEYSPIIDMFFKCRNTNNAAVQDFGKAHLSSREQYAALVQIIKDDNHPELVGKIKVFKFGKKVWDKLYNEMHPAMGQGANPFHPIYGRYFYIKCIAQSGFNNFDQSYFFDNKNAQGQVVPSGFYYEDPATPGQMQVVTEQSNQQAVADYLSANSPDLSKYDYHPWTAEQKQFVDEVLQIIANYLQNGGNLQGNMQMNLQTLNTPTPTAPAAAPSGFGQFMGAAPAPAAPVMPQTMSAPAPAPQVVNPTPASADGLSLGESTIPGVPAPTMTSPTITGIDIPSVEPSNVGFNPTPAAGIGGNIDSVIANL